jgi:gas vesicle protein
VGYTSAQLATLSSHVGDETRKTIGESLSRMEDFATVLDSLAGKRIDDLDQKIREYLRWIEEYTKRVSSEAEKLIRVVSEETQNVIRTSSDELKEVVGITGDEFRSAVMTASDEMDQLLKQSGDQGIRITRSVGEQGVQLVKVAGEQSVQVTQEVGDEGVRITQTIGDEGIRITKASSEELRSVIKLTGNETRLTVQEAIRQSGEIAVDVTEEVSQEAQNVIEATTENLKEVISQTSKETQVIIDAIESSSLRVVDRSGAVALYLVNRTADLLLAVGAAGAGLVFLFVASYGWGKAILQYQLPEKYVTRVIVISFMGMTWVSAFAPFIFLNSGVRAQVLLPMSLAKPFTDVVGQVPTIPNEPEVERVEPEQIVLGRDDSNSVSFLKIYGTNLLANGIPVAKFGDAELVISGKRNNLLTINLSQVYENPGLADMVVISTQTDSSSEKFLVSVPVIMNESVQPRKPSETRSNHQESQELTNSLSSKSTCGDPLPDDPQAYPVSFYPVFVEFTEDNLRTVQNFCSDAYSTPRQINNKEEKAIQVASFSSLEHANSFKNLILREIGSGEVGQSTVIQAKN